MSSFTTTTNEPQNRTQRRLIFEGFNVHDNGSSTRRNHSSTMFTSTPDHKLHEKEKESLDLIQTNESQPSESCLLQLQNARQLLHSMSRTNILPTNEQPLTDDQQQPRSEIFSETNPELAYYKSSLESERNRRKQLETLIDVQQQRLTETESELIQLRANDHKKTLCMKQLEQMIPNVVEEWKQKENDYKTKINNITQQIKQIEQTNRDKNLLDKQQFDGQLNEKTLIIERLTKDNEKLKQDYENIQGKIKQNEQRIQQLIKDSDESKQRSSNIENDLRNEIKANETRLMNIQTELDKKQQEIEQILRDQHKLNNDHQTKIRQIENELDEQRRENNVLKMELELREAKYRAQTESLKIQFIRDAETKLTQRLDEQHAKHIQIENELNELHRRKLSDLEEKHEQILSNERHEHENRVQTLLTKLDKMKNELERLQTTTMTERQDLAKKLQDVFETALFQGSKKPNFPQLDIVNSPPTTTSLQMNQNKTQPIDTQIKSKTNDFIHSIPLTSNDHPTNISTIRTLSTRIDSLVDQTNRVANGFEINSRLPITIPHENNSEWIDNNQNNPLSSRPESALHSPFYRSTPIDPLQEWYPQTKTQPLFQSNNNHLIIRSQSADPSSSGLFSTYPSLNQQQLSSNSFSLENNLNKNQNLQTEISSYRSTSSMPINIPDRQQNVHPTISKDSIEKQQSDQSSSTNESLARYVKMLLERSPTKDENPSNKHPLAKTNRSLHDLQLSIERLNLAERDPKIIVDDLVLQNDDQSPPGVTPRQTKPTYHTAGGAKKRLDYDINNQKQSNTNDLFERLSQPKTRIKKDKIKHDQQSAAGAHGAWK